MVLEVWIGFGPACPHFTKASTVSEKFHATFSDYKLPYLNYVDITLLINQLDSEVLIKKYALAPSSFFNTLFPSLN